MLPQLAWRMIRSTRSGILWNFATTFGIQGILSIRRFHQRVAEGRQFPPFLFLSITNRCNLKCQGCWVTTAPPWQNLDIRTIHRVIRQAGRQGTRFFGIMGGEPLLHPDLFDIFEKHPRCYFQLFTNGTLITRDAARRLARAGNVTPLVSVEGDHIVSDLRRGGKAVYGRTLAGLDHCIEAGMVTGVATSVCTTNIDTLVTERFLDRLIDRGVHYAWYYVFRPAGVDPHPELALSPDQLVALRRFIVEMRARKPIVIVDTYHDQHGEALCPASEGMSYHISPWGDVEPCPPIQFARENIHESKDVVSLIDHSTFLRDFREFAADCTKGCVFLESPERLAAFLRKHGARDSTGRGTGYAELAARCPLHSHHLPGREVPEKHWAYRFAKRHWFFGFGAYA